MIVKTDEETVGLDYDLTEVMRKLVDQSFLPVLGENREFMGIITRKSILKAINALCIISPSIKRRQEMKQAIESFIQSKRSVSTAKSPIPMTCSNL